MASQSSLAGLMVAIVAISSMSLAAAATNHVVGGSFGWNIPQSNPTVYSTWSSANTFALGDTLEFKFPTGLHQVVHVTKAGYDQCNTTLKIGNVLTTGPATVTLNSTGTSYFICGIPGHCSLGQKLSITVGSSPTPGTSPPPKSSAPTPAPAPRSSVPLPTPPTAPTPAPAPKSSAPTTPTAPSSSAPTPPTAPSSSAPTPPTAPSSSAPTPPTAPTPAPAPKSSAPTTPTAPSSSAPTPPTAAGPASSTPGSDSGKSAATSLPAGLLMVVAVVSVASSLMF